jgi:hypothetical protein
VEGYRQGLTTCGLSLDFTQTAEKTAEARQAGPVSDAWVKAGQPAREAGARFRIPDPSEKGAAALVALKLHSMNWPVIPINGATKSPRGKGWQRADRGKFLQDTCGKVTALALVELFSACFQDLRNPIYVVQGSVALGARLVFLGKYAPNLNPIEWLKFQRTEHRSLSKPTRQSELPAANLPFHPMRNRPPAH